MSRKPLEYQIHISQIAGIILAILTSFAISLYYNLTNKQAFLDQNISNVGNPSSWRAIPLILPRQKEPWACSAVPSTR